MFWGQLLCQGQKICNASEIRAVVELFLVCIADSSSDNFCVFLRWKEEPFPCAAGSGGEAFTAPSCWRPEPNPAIYSSPTWSHYTSLFSCASLVCSESTALPGWLLSLWTVPVPAWRLLTCCCSAMHWTQSYKSLGHYTEPWASPMKFLHITLAPKLTWIAL